MFFKITALISLIVGFIQGAPNDVHIVQTKLGAIAGIEIENDGDKSPIYRFLGIPYAKPPVGPLRFAEPQQRTEHFKGTWHAKYTFRCLQFLPNINKVLGYEDCLYLNIFTTSLDKKANLDVIVFIHGGGFFYGTNYSQTQEYLLSANNKVVFVAINYRLGAFGFLSTDDEVVPGNMGLKDQVLALEWIQENIKLFGGNPNKVTIAGMSAGGISVHLHYFSPLSRNLFSQGISMSGAALSPLIRTKDVRKETEKLATLFNCPTEDSAKMVDCLKLVEGPPLVQKLVSAETPWEPFNSYINFLPVIERAGSRPFLDEHPYHTLRKGKIKHAPWLASTTTAEGLKPAALFVAKNDLLQTLNDNWDNIAPYMLLYENIASKDKLPQISQTIKHEYLKDQPVTVDSRNQLIKMVGDRLYMTNIENAIRLHAAASKAPVYVYVFDYRGKYSFSSVWSETDLDLGVSHIDDMIYILKMHKLMPLEQDSAMVDTMTSIWTNYIRTGVPNANNGVPWPKVPKNIVYGGDLPYVKINGPSELKVTKSADISRRDFWDSLPLEELHVSGDRLVPKYIQEQQRPGWFHQVIIKPIRKTISRLMDPFFRYLKSRNRDPPPLPKT